MRPLLILCMFLLGKMEKVRPLFYLALCVISLCYGGACATVYTSCASGCSATSITGALALASNGDTVQLNSSVSSESVTCTKNVTFTALNKSVTWSCTSSKPNLILPVGLTGPCTVLNMVLNNTAGDFYIIDNTGIGVGASYAVIGNTLIHSGTGGELHFGQVYITTNQVYIDSNTIISTSAGNGRVDILLDGIDLSDNLYQISRNIIIFTGASASRTGISLSNGTCATSCGNVYNNTISVSGNAINNSERMTGKNNLVNSTSSNGIGVSGTGALAQHTYTGDTSSQALGTGSVTITTTRTWVNYSGKTFFDFRLSPGSQCIYAGTAITGVTDGLDIYGNKFNSTTPSMGCFQYYCPIGMGYGCWLWDELKGLLTGEPWRFS